MFIAAISSDLIGTEFIQNIIAAVKATKTSVSKLQSHKEIVEFFVLFLFVSKIEFLSSLEQFFVASMHCLLTDDPFGSSNAPLFLMSACFT